MSAIYKDHYITLDTKRTPKVALQNIVAGETGNRLIITVTSNDTVVTLTNESKVTLIVGSNNGVRKQTDATFSDGKAYIVLQPETYAAGLNRARLEITTTATVTDDTYIFTAEFQFDATSVVGNTVAGWHRGSTPTHSFYCPIDLTGAGVWVTYAQDGKVVAQVDNPTVTVSEGVSTATWTLTEQQTLNMVVGDCMIQAHYMLDGVTDHSDEWVGKVKYTQGV